MGSLKDDPIKGREREEGRHENIGEWWVSGDEIPPPSLPLLLLLLLLLLLRCRGILIGPVFSFHSPSFPPPPPLSIHLRSISDRAASSSSPSLEKLSRRRTKEAGEALQRERERRRKSPLWHNVVVGWGEERERVRERESERERGSDQR